VISDSGNGLFVAASDGATRDIHIEDNWNRRQRQRRQHLRAQHLHGGRIGIVYEGNRFGPLRRGAGGKQPEGPLGRAGLRYNWIEAGNRQLDLVDAEDSPD
jgi:hypothetical protein